MSMVSCGVAVASVAAIVVASLGLAGVCSIQAVCITGLVTQTLNIPILIVSILGLTGHASMGVVSGVVLGFSILAFMVSSVACCLGR